MPEHRKLQIFESEIDSFMSPSQVLEILSKNENVLVDSQTLTNIIGSATCQRVLIRVTKGTKFFREFYYGLSFEGDDLVHAFECDEEWY